MATLPPAGFASRPLVLHTPPPVKPWLRLYDRTFPDPLGFGKSPSRYSDPRALPPDERYGVVYGGSSLKVSVLEAIVRDRGDGRLGDLLIAWSEFEALNCAEIAIGPTVQLVDLRGDGPIVMGVPSDAVRASDQALGQAWALAFHEHNARPDGIIYPSRLNGHDNIALFDRALARVAPIGIGPLPARGAELAAVIRELQLAII